MEVTQSFYNLIAEVPTRLFCCILLIRSEALGPASTVGLHRALIPGGGASWEPF